MAARNWSRSCPRPSTARSTCPARLDQTQPVVVYCWDSLGDMSPRAACRLQLLGFTWVHDHVAGKADWLAHGLSTQGEQAQVPRAKDVLRRDAVTAGPEELVGVVALRVAGSPYGFASVVAEDGTLLGRLRKAVLDPDPVVRAEQVMEAGPSTVRADRPLAELAERLRRRGLRTAIVTAPDGKLLGVVRRVDMDAKIPIIWDVLRRADQWAQETGWEPGPSDA
jgi:CBS domain-containing protein